MALITWSNDLSVHNEEIDEQHKNWIGIINKMHESMLSDNYKAFNENFKEYIREMVDYTSYHFAFEEQYLVSTHYPGLAEHTRKHKEFIEKLAEAVRNMRSGDMLLHSNFLKMARYWLVDHIMVEDKEYSLYVDRKTEP